MNSTTTLELEISNFTQSLPYWSRFVASRILEGNQISEEDITSSYSYLLEELGLIPETIKPEIVSYCNQNNLGKYKTDLLFSKLEEVEGVNALIEGQTINFGPNLTILYGENGSGKSGYIRLFKSAFYSKAPEEILPNIHLESLCKPIKASFTFNSNGEDVQLIFPMQKENFEFEQYSVFDGKSALKHLEQKNEFVFRPAGLEFFAEFILAINRVKEKLDLGIENKEKDCLHEYLINFFDGESEIKTTVSNLSEKTEISDIKKYTPFSAEDNLRKINLEKKYGELQVSFARKSKDILELENLLSLLDKKIIEIKGLNGYFGMDYFQKIHNSITDCIQKDALAKNEGAENFKNTEIVGVGGEEWKAFLRSAASFAKTQKNTHAPYPEIGDKCIFCQQSLSEDSQKLIHDYWIYIKSVSEKNAQDARSSLDKVIADLESLNFDLFSDEATLTAWLKEKYPAVLDVLNKTLVAQKSLTNQLIVDIKNRNNIEEKKEVQISCKDCDFIRDEIEASIKVLKDGDQNKELEKLLAEVTYFVHKEKLNTLFSNFEQYINNQKWINSAKNADFGKTKITNIEKTLSNKYFNQKYTDIFIDECKRLKGGFGIEIGNTASAGKTYRQLKIKGKLPNSILSEGEQKVIAMADFLTEMHLSSVNRGIIFDDPVCSLDDVRKSDIAERLVKESLIKQVIILTHDLVFVSSLINNCKESDAKYYCHWVENVGNNQPGKIWENNAPSFEKEYKTSGKAQSYYEEALNLGPKEREDKIKNGFAALRTSYESQVVFGLFAGVVQRFNERISVDSLKKVVYNKEIVDDLIDGYEQCCRYMEGHSHSDKYAYKKPNLEDFKSELQRFSVIKKKIDDLRKGINENPSLA